MSPTTRPPAKLIGVKPQITKQYQISSPVIGRPPNVTRSIEPEFFLFSSEVFKILLTNKNFNKKLTRNTARPAKNEILKFNSKFTNKTTAINKA